jgi:deoxyribodipyrimidine photo-lyase
MKKAIHWFRQDLRLADNPSLQKAVNFGAVIPIYILDEEHSGKFFLGAASRWWLHNSLNHLNESLGKKLLLFKGDPLKIIPKLVEEEGVEGVFWNRCYEPWRLSRDTILKGNLLSLGVKVESSNGSLLWEPWEVLKSDKTPYRVFTPFYRKGCLKAEPPRAPLIKPEKIQFADVKSYSLSLADLKLLPKIQWYKAMAEVWEIGEEGAQTRLNTFINEGLNNYRDGRNFPAQKCVSRLSPYLHFGEISPNQVWYSLEDFPNDNNSEHFKSELGWREFSYSLLYFNHNLPTENLNKKFDSFPWNKDLSLLKAWQHGRTGYPIVDAGMRQMWQTGYMHNRLRMVVASFLIKNLLIPWQEGERWFWDCLLDADLANNSASWQWVAGSGADAAPYFRIFNPVMQGEKFDEIGEFTREFVPELKDLPNKYLFKPWQASESILRSAGIVLGETYPYPIVDQAISRDEALAAFKQLK